MTSHNPYQPPNSQPRDPIDSRRITPAAIVGAVCVALQTAASALSLFADLQMVRTGEMSPIHWLLFLCTVLALAFAAVLLLRGRPAARYAAGFALLSALLLLSQWLVIFYATHAIVAAGIVILSIVKGGARQQGSA